MADHNPIEIRTIIKHRASREPWIERHASLEAADEWVVAEREEYGATIEYARVEWRMVSSWIGPPDRRFFNRRSEANSPRSEIEPNRRSGTDRRSATDQGRDDDQA